MIMTMAVTLAMARAMAMTIIQVFAFGAIVLGIFPHRRYESFVTNHGMCGSPGLWFRRNGSSCSSAGLWFRRNGFLKTPCFTVGSLKHPVLNI